MTNTGIYIHIPFCVRKCKYCDFFSGTYNNEIKKNYVDALINEIRQSSKFQENRLIKTIYFGGGTPSSLDASYIERIIFEIKNEFKVCDDAEITIEVNPGTADLKKFKSYVSSGINRVSIGLQSADNKQLKILGRIHTYEQFLQCYKDARNAGIKNINIDVMSAIPKQSLESYIDTLNKVISLNPEHISSYSLIIEEGTPFYEHADSLDLVDEDTEREMYYATNRILSKNGYHRYEISNYSKKEYESKHNTSYWKGVEYFGFGVGASSYINNIRYSNVADINKYIEVMLSDNINNKNDIRTDIEVLTMQQRMEEFMFLGLRCIEGISICEFEERFGKSIYDVYGDVINEHINNKLLYKLKDKIMLTEKGIDISNIVLADFLK